MIWKRSSMDWLETVGFEIVCPGWFKKWLHYQGKGESHSGRGLSYDVVMDLLTSSSLGTGYHMLLHKSHSASGSSQEPLWGLWYHLGKQNWLLEVKNKRSSLKRRRGDMRWTRTGSVLCLKWIDAREVAVCSQGIQWRDSRALGQEPRWHLAIFPGHRRSWSGEGVHNEYMGGVDLSDTLINHSLSKKDNGVLPKTGSSKNSYINHKELTQGTLLRSPVPAACGFPERRGQKKTSLKRTAEAVKVRDDSQVL